MHYLWRGWFGLGMIILMAVMTTGTAYAQCAMCVTGLTQSPEGQQMARSFNQAILLLLALPYGIAGTIAFLILRARARARGISVWRMLTEHLRWRHA